MKMKLPACLLCACLVVVPVFTLQEKVADEGHELRSLQVSARIVDGKDAKFKRYPYYVTLSSTEDDSNIICGGSLIASNVVLTAAHCGGLMKYAIIGGEEVIPIKHRYRAKEYDSLLDRFDKQAVLLEWDSKKQPVTVNLSDDVPSKSKEEIVVIGMGREGLNLGTSDTLQEVAMDYIPNDKCEEANTKTFSYAGRIYDDMICIESKAESPCRGDSGGPLLILGGSPEEDLQVGTVSWGVGCDTSDFPAVGARTSATDFIQRVVCDFATTKPEYLCKDRPRPTLDPTRLPSQSPSPSTYPTMAPTKSPSPSVSFSPSVSKFPTRSPTKYPTSEPSESPSEDPNVDRIINLAARNDRQFDRPLKLTRPGVA